jgi:DNA-binding GntR family transcriptional regulator
MFSGVFTYEKLINVPNLTELTYRSVKEQVLDGTLREGMRLTEEQLANQLGIGKSPVREALNRLEAEGLISIESRRGAYVREFSMGPAAEIVQKSRRYNTFSGIDERDHDRHPICGVETPE